MSYALFNLRPLFMWTGVLKNGFSEEKTCDENLILVKLQVFNLIF